MKRFSGRDVEARLGSGRRVLFEQVNVNVDDGIAAAHDQGFPAGWVPGQVSADGDIQVSTETLLELNEEAELAGSWEEMEAFDISFYASVGGREMDLRCHGVKLRMPNFPINGQGGEKLMHTINLLVTGEDFISLNGVPLARRRPA